MREGYDAQQVCLNGHQISAHYYDYPQHRQKHCNQCGAATVHQCPACKADIKGYYTVRGVIGFSGPSVPLRCENCGEAYPWTEKLSAKKGKEVLDALPVGAVLTKLCTRFPLVVEQLRRRHDGRDTLDVVDEYDVQDVLHALLHLFFEDVRAEEVVPSYAAKSTRMDFLLKSESVVVEAKMTRKGLQAKEVGEQLVLDANYYQAHPDCKCLYCLVYDPTRRIANPRGLEKDLSKKHGPLDVKAFVVS